MQIFDQFFSTYIFIVTLTVLMMICHQPAAANDDIMIPPSSLSSSKNAMKVSQFDTKMSLYMEPVQGSTFIFEVAERDVQCFHEDFYEEHNFILEYRVLGGGMLDIDVSIIGPEGEDIYSVKRTSNDAIIFSTFPARNFSFCFGNTFSTISKKKVYFSLQAESQATLSTKLGIRKPTVLTALEASQEEIYSYLRDVIESQKEYRLSEAVDSNYAINLSDKVGWLTFWCTAAMVITGIGQTFVLKYFFTQYGKTPQKI